MTRDPESKLPVLLMELLDESLTKMLECSQQSPLAYYVQVDICHDIALAVAYLHSNDIIHRDLSSNNVLMIAGRRAKVTDFGMSKLAGATPSMTPLTMCPGTLAYMPPEALREPPRYTKKLDSFSEGVIMIQVCTRLWPEPGPRTERKLDPTSPTGEVEVPVLETERRKNHIDSIRHDHPLVPIANHCLHYQERSRPSSEELCQRLAGLKGSREYRESKQNHINEIQAKDNQIVSQARQLQEKDTLLQQRAEQIASQNQQLHDKNRLIQDKDNQLQQYALQKRQFRQQLKEQEKVTAVIQQTNHSLQRQVEQLQQQLSQQSLKPPQPPPPSQAQVRGGQLQERESLKQLPVQPDHQPHPRRGRKITLNWKYGGKAPLKMSEGIAVVNGSVAYFMNGCGEICCYNSTNKKWSQLPKCPHVYTGSSLAVVNGQLTAIGGCKDVFRRNSYTNKLFSLPSYEEIFPPMPTRRRNTAAVTTKEHLIVAGGTTGLSTTTNNITTVEVMETKTLVWSTVASLPHPYNNASGTICRNQFYMLGGNDNKDMTKSMVTCSLTELLQSSSSSSSSSSVWHRVADAPAYLSTCAIVNGELLAVGGRDKDDKPTAAIHKYNPTTNSWDLISKMTTARYCSLVAVLPTNEMMVVGGRIEGWQYIDNVEVARFNLS